MNRLIKYAILALITSCAFSSIATAKSVNSDPSASKSSAKVADWVEHHIKVISASGGYEYEVHEPGASFIKLHFAQFDLPKGLEVEISNPEGTESYRYSNVHRDGFTFDVSQGDDGVNSFSAMSIGGDTAIVRIRKVAATKDSRARSKSRGLKSRI
jgi:hypothetical protein